MAISYTAETLVESARRRGQLTRAAGTLTTDDLIAMMDDELHTYIVSYLMQLRQEFFVKDYDLTLSSGVAEYGLPPRAVGGKLRDVRIQIADASPQFARITRIEPERVFTPPLGDALPQNFYFKGNKIVFIPCGAGTARLSYFLRPGHLVRDDQAAQITAINTGTGVLTLSNVPDEFTSGETYDLVQDQPFFETQALDLTGTVDANALTMTLPTPLPTGLAVGDWLCLSETSPVVQIPPEVHPLLAQRTVVKALEAQGDDRGEQFSKMALEEEKRLTSMLVGERDQGSPRYIINRSGPGWRRRAAWW